MSSVPNDWNLHRSVLGIVYYNALKSIGESKVVFVRGKALLDETGCNGYFSGLVLHRRAVEVARVFLRGKGGHCPVHVLSLDDFDGRVAYEVLSLILGVLVDGHGVLKEILKISTTGVLEESSVMLCVEIFLVHCSKLLLRRLISSSWDTVSDTLGCLFGVSSSKLVLGLNSRNIASVTRNTLISDIVERTVNPSLRITTVISNHNVSLRLFQDRFSLSWEFLD